MFHTVICASKAFSITAVPTPPTLQMYKQMKLRLGTIGHVRMLDNFLLVLIPLQQLADMETLTVSRCC